MRHVLITPLLLAACAGGPPQGNRSLAKADVVLVGSARQAAPQEEAV